MKKTQNIQKIKEGKTQVFVLKNKIHKRGPGKKHYEPFYNPAMELNRDLSILINQWLVNNQKKPVSLLDGLAASGIRGIRLANEVQGEINVTVNDWNPQAYNLIKKNIQQNKQKNVVATNQNLNTLLSENKYNYIDIDPYGSPIYFIDSAMRSIKNNGIIACTATDTATLCGVYPKVCIRRYGARPWHNFMMHEIGLRILLGCLCREAAKYDKGIKPILNHITDHYFRTYIQVKNGKNHANTSIKQLSIINPKNLFFKSKNNETNIGPLWIGKLQNKKIIQEIRTNLFEKQLNTKHELWKLLSLLEEEADSPAFFYTTNDIASYLKIPVPRIEDIFEILKKKGYIATKTHFCLTGFKTDASFKTTERIFKNLK